jgi:hypothetical protein
MSQKDLLTNQVIEEILRERANSYFIRKKPIDFWLLISPSFVFTPSIFNKIKKTSFYNQQKSTISSSKTENRTEKNEFYAALVSTDKEFIKWIQLRLGYFENIMCSIEEITNNQYVSDGVVGQFEIGSNLEIFSPLEYHSSYLHPDIYLAKYKKGLENLYLQQLSKISSSSMNKIKIGE